MTDPYPFDDLLATKMEIPFIGPRIVPRRRLTDILKEGMEKRLTLVTAPTGYGKTTLLVEWLSAIKFPDWRILWITIDTDDNEPFRLWSQIATYTKKIYPRLHIDPRRLFQDQADKSHFSSLTPLINAITQIPYQLILILDDYQWINDERVHQEIRYLLDHQPKNLHLLISSRVTPPFPLCRLRAQRQLVEITAEDLSFTLPEAIHFFSSVMEVDLDQEQAASLLVATEGWIAGLQLITLSLQNRPDRKTFIANLPEVDPQIFEYLTEEVLDQQDPELRDFMLKTSLLPEFSAPLCDAIFNRRDSAEMLKRIQQANLFIVSLDERRHWFSFHRLFADTLQKYLREAYPDIIPELHRQASDWLQQNGYPDKAVSHALAVGDVERAARIIDACALQAVIRFDLVQLAQWIGRFSDDLISQRPQLAIYYALANFLVERFDNVEPMLQALEQILAKAIAEGRHIEDESLIRWEIESIRASLDYWKPGIVAASNHLTALMQNPPKGDVYFYGFMHHGLAEVYAAQGNLDAAAAAYTKGARFALDYGLLNEYCYSQSELAYVRKLQGRLSDAAEEYQTMLDYALHNELAEDVIGFARTGLAEVALEQNRLDDAGEQVQWVVENFERIETSPLNWIRQEWIYVRLARYYLARKDLANARVYFEKAVHGFHANPQMVHYLTTQYIDVQVRLWAATGELRDRHLDFEEQVRSFDPLGKTRLALQMAQVRFYLAQEQPDLALETLNECIPGFQNTGINDGLLAARILQALACQALGATQQAFQALNQALCLAAPEGYRRVFLDEGQPMKDLLELAVRQPLEGEAGKLADSLIRELDAEGSSQGPSEPKARSGSQLVVPLFEPLSHRELEILQLLIDGKTTKEIAAILSVSINTTKVHMRSLYRKAGAHTRSALIQRVAELGIMER